MLTNYNQILLMVKRLDLLPLRKR